MVGCRPQHHSGQGGALLRRREPEPSARSVRSTPSLLARLRHDIASFGRFLRWVPVMLEAEHYELQDGNARIDLGSEVVYLKVRAKPLRLTGSVSDVRNQPLPGARLSLGDYIAVTDVNGRFVLVLPADLPESERTMTITAAGHAVWRGPVTPDGNPLMVQLSAEVR